MDNTKFEQWCNKATAGIRYRPDRCVVAAELQAHMEDHRDTLINQGVAPDEAEAQALAAMGSPKEIASQLAAIHRPWLGYLYSTVRFFAVAAAVFALFLWMSLAGSFLNMLIDAHHFESIPANHSPLDYYSQQTVTAHSDGYRFQITEVGYSQEKSELYFDLQITQWPWQGETSINECFWAVDNLGNYYASMEEDYYSDNPRVTAIGRSSTSCITCHHMQIMRFDCDAEWIELHYNRDGRNIILRIDLTGGGAQ